MTSASDVSKEQLMQGRIEIQRLKEEAKDVGFFSSLNPFDDSITDKLAAKKDEMSRLIRETNMDKFTNVIQETTDTVTNTAIDTAAEVRSKAGDLGEEAGSWISKGYNWLTRGREAGGIVPNKSITAVGEKGPELLKTDASGQSTVIAAGKKETQFPGEENIKDMIKRHEGLRLKRRYNYSLGYPIVGYGHKMTKYDIEWPNPITEEFANKVFEIDYIKHRRMAQHYPNFSKFNKPVQGAIIDMSFNMGKFWDHQDQFKTSYWKKMLVDYTNKGDFEGASDSILKTGYAKQVKERAVEIANLIKMGDNGEVGFPSSMANGKPASGDPGTVKNGGVSSDSESGDWFSKAIDAIKKTLKGLISDGSFNNSMDGSSSDSKSGGGVIDSSGMPDRNLNDSLNKYKDKLLWDQYSKYAPNTHYKMGSKTPGKQIDCSGMTSWATRKTMSKINADAEKEGNEAIFSKKAKKNLMTGAAWQYEQVKNAGGGSLSGLDQMVSSAKGGELGFLNTGPNSHAAMENRPGHWSHVIQFLKNPETGEMHIGESRSSKNKVSGKGGVMISPYSQYKEYLARKNPSGSWKFGMTDPFRTNETTFNALAPGTNEIQAKERMTEQQAQIDGIPVGRLGIRSLDKDGMAYLHKGESVLSTEKNRRLEQMQNVINDMRVKGSNVPRHNINTKLSLSDIDSGISNMRSNMESMMGQISQNISSLQPQGGGTGGGPTVVPVPINTGGTTKPDSTASFSPGDSKLDIICGQLMNSVETAMNIEMEGLMGYKPGKS